jgi:HAD superfamily hydrolase (TIGR01549 family)
MTKPLQCPHCGAKGSLTAVGPGVERLAEEVHTRFHGARVEVLSSDTVTSPEGLRELIARMEAGAIDILIGTQIVAKGHNFPTLTLVGVVDADAGLRGGDLRAGERTFQLLQQVAGRAGRADKPGRAIIQTYSPESPAIALLAAGDDPALARPAFEAFFEARQQVDLFADVLPALGRLSARWPIVALSNGNADVHRVPGLGRYFHAAVSARDLGLAKPDPASFAAACARAAAEPGRTLHIGDDAALDIDGALDAGLQAAWVCRPGLPSADLAPRGRPHHVVASLAELADRLGA